MATAQVDSPPVSDEQIDESPAKPRKKKAAKTRNKTKKLPPYAVVLHNDDLNGMDHVVMALRKVFNYGRTKCVWLMMKAHVTGQSIIWTGSLEVAELKADQLKSCGPDPSMKQKGATSLSVTIEPLPS